MANLPGWAAKNTGPSEGRLALGQGLGEFGLTVVKVVARRARHDWMPEPEDAMRRLVCLLSAASLFAVGAAAATREAPAPAPYDIEIERMAVDQEVVIGGVQLACTGIGDTRQDPKWAAYPVRVEFSDAKNQYMTDALVALIDAKGEAVLMVRCDSPWLLLKPAPGTYSVYAQLMEGSTQMRSARFSVPKSGQKRIVLQFPDV
jgi:hypothetical protein